MCQDLWEGCEEGSVNYPLHTPVKAPPRAPEGLLERVTFREVCTVNMFGTKLCPELSRVRRQHIETSCAAEILARARKD